MWQLLKLEWRKHRMSRYFLSFFSCIVGIYGFVIFAALSSKHDIDGLMASYQEFLTLVTLLTNITFIILGGVILSRVIISEFRTKTINVLFTYPIRRKVLMLSKLLLVFTVTTVGLFLGTWIMQVLTYFLQPSLGLFEGTFTMQEMLATIPKTVTNAIMMGAIALIPLYFGMRKKSTSATITSAVIIGFLINSTVSNGGASFSLSDVIIIPLIFSLLGAGIAYLSIRNIDRKDVV
ncbi:ABC transporter permease [Sporosarcina cyprini]|uniref:ABC transporter permease n=1 Tax=Sporosarcina cyprini TaxID=2910523 RepID=UPI001EDF08E7|nr:ABC transporter permease [Sporosarcina cyprini]MCG3088572.1 ABC transporter permease [Sporosarcina cyprini]